MWSWEHEKAGNQALYQGFAVGGWRVRVSQIIRFVYHYPPPRARAASGNPFGRGRPRKNPLAAPSEKPVHHDPNKVILVLHPNWRGNVHGIDLKRLTSAERAVIDAIFNPAVRVNHFMRGRLHHIPLVNSIVRQMNPIELIRNPRQFYRRFVKAFFMHKDVYRLYKHERMSNIVITNKSRALAGDRWFESYFQKMDKRHPDLAGQGRGSTSNLSDPSKAPGTQRAGMRFGNPIFSFKKPGEK